MFLIESTSSMFGLRALRRFGDARAEGRVGMLLGFFLMLCGVLHFIHCLGCEVQGRGDLSGVGGKVSSNLL